MWAVVAQLGQRKGGFYALAWLERLCSFQIYNTFDRVEEWQRVEPGDFLFYHQSGIGSQVVQVEPGRSFTTLSDLATATGERRSVQLPDGTRLQLNTDSAVDLDFSAQQRLITLVRGEILVTCGTTLSAPLLVQTRHGLLEGIDGRFSVRQDSDCTRLSVVSGNVAIHSPHSADGLWTQAHAGENYRVNQTHATPAPPLDMDVGAWTDGLIVTRGMRLADFLSEVGRYRHGYLGCSADVAGLRLSGVFRLEDTDKLLAILPQTLPVRVRYRTRWWVSLERSA